MKRLEQIRARRPFGSVSEDGSGWVSVSTTSNDQISDFSPTRRRPGRNDSPLLSEVMVTLYMPWRGQCY